MENKRVLFEFHANPPFDDLNKCRKDVAERIALLDEQLKCFKDDKDIISRTLYLYDMQKSNLNNFQQEHYAAFELAMRTIDFLCKLYSDQKKELESMWNPLSDLREKIHDQERNIREFSSKSGIEFIQGSQNELQNFLRMLKFSIRSQENEEIEKDILEYKMNKKTYNWNESVWEWNDKTQKIHDLMSVTAKMLQIPDPQKDQQIAEPDDDLKLSDSDKDTLDQLIPEHVSYLKECLEELHKLEEGNCELIKSLKKDPNRKYTKASIRNELRVRLKRLAESFSKLEPLSKECGKILEEFYNDKNFPRPDHKQITVLQKIGAKLDSAAYLYDIKPGKRRKPPHSDAKQNNVMDNGKDNQIENKDEGNALS